MSDHSYIDVEYRELNNHIRECWKYISDLLRNFLFLQIILISLVFLGGNILRIEGISVSVQSTEEAAPGDARAKNQTESRSDSRFRKLPILTLMAIALLGSIGAAVQNYRLFNNATNFIHRAAYLELKGEFLKDNRTSRSEKTVPANTYMSENLYPGKKVSLRNLLVGIYLGFAVLWGYTLVLFVHSLGS